MTLRSVIRNVDGMENLFVLTSGSPPPNPTELLASAKMDQILAEAVREADIVIVDSPPSLVADFQVLATKMDGVVLVIKPGHTHADSAFAMLDQLNRVNARPLGVVLNKIPRRDSYYGGYNYYYPYKRGYYYTHDEKAPLPVDSPSPRLLTESESNLYLQQADSEMDVYYQGASARESAERMEVYPPPQNTSATANPSTKPRQKVDALQRIQVSKENIKVWYAGMDEDKKN
jgi:cellulose biosynthesis protein BcsQ